MDNRRRGAAAKYVTVVLVALLGGLAFAAVSATVNGQPATDPFQGWVMILGQGNKVEEHQEVELAVHALVSGAPGDRPELVYTVAACGSQPFRGVLLFGGDARLSNARVFAGHRSDVEEIPNLVVRDDSTGSIMELGAVQKLDIEIEHLPACLSSVSPDRVDSGFLGAAQEVAGSAGAPVQRTWELAWWTGPRTTYVWPLVGTFPGVSVHLRGVFEGIQGLSGSWTIPTPGRFQVSAGGVNLRADVEVARPELSDESSLTWVGVHPFAPSARLTDVEAMSAWQQGLIAASIALGITGSLLASVFFEWARRPVEQRVTARESTLYRKQPKARSEDSRTAFALLIVVMLIARAWQKRRPH